MKPVFILGGERSGSTWLTNIFDAHPGVELFMEPFAELLKIFPGFPGRNIYLSGGEEQHLHCIKKGYQRLYRLKYPFFYRSGRPLYLKKWDRFLLAQWQRVSRKFHWEMSLKFWRYFLLHLNTHTIPLHQQARKSRRRPPLEVTKELRLNFKIGLLSRAFPGALYVVIIRHPGAQISSILRLFRKGSLEQLYRSLQTFIDDIRPHDRFEKYGQLIDHFDNSRAEAADFRLILWWLINYEVLLEDLQKYGCPFQLVYHEEISEKPGAAVSDIFDFVGLEMTEEVRNYLEISTSTQLREIQSNVDTNRKSADYYKQMIDGVDPVLNQKIQEVLCYFHSSTAMNSSLVHYLEKFYPLSRPY